MTDTLKMVGFWRGTHAPLLPDPQLLVDPKWSPHDVDDIVRYLKQGVRFAEYLGCSRCRFPGGPPDNMMGNADFTDGVWLWPEGLYIYIRDFHVRLPDSFLHHCRANGFRIPEWVESKVASGWEPKFDFGPWLEWSGSVSARGASES